MIRPEVLILCSGNSCQTQIAGGFLRNLAGRAPAACAAFGTNSGSMSFNFSAKPFLSEQP
jgi:protein-tyrosine-phosphatase